jgi:hypothetical protein
METIAKAILAYDWGQSREPFLELEYLVRKSFGQPERLRQIEESLLRILETTAKYSVKRQVCKHLRLVGTERSVATLAALLPDPETSDLARYAMEGIGSAQVEAALRAALAKTDGRAKIGIVNSLGVRRDAQAVPALGRLLADADLQIAAAAACALGKIGGDATADVLTQARDKYPDAVNREILHALLECADRFLADGQNARAMTIYRTLTAEKLPKPIRNAAVRGLVLTAKAK